MLLTTQEIAKERTGQPAFISVDEEGDEVARNGGNYYFGVPVIGSMAEIWLIGDQYEAERVGEIQT